MFQKRFFGILLFAILSQIAYAQDKIDFTEEEKAWIKAHPTVYFGYEPNWPPFEMYNDGEYQGIIGDYVKIIEKETGIDMVPGPPLQWQETLDKFENGEIKVLTSVGFSRNKYNNYAFTDPFIKDALVIVTRKKFKTIKTLSDITTQRIAVPKGYSRQRVLREDFPNTEPIYVNDVKECLELISKNKADLFVGSYSVISYYLNDLGYNNLKSQPIPSGRFIKLCFGVNKDIEVFRDIVQKVLNSMSDNDRYRIYSRWIVIRYEGVIEKKKLKQYIFLSLLVFVTALCLFYLWNKTLRNQIKIRAKAENNLKESLALINEKNAEKDVLLKEIHHRVKNNLQIVYSMLNMQSREIDDNSEALKIISEGKSRVMAMALIHKILYESDKLDKVSLDSYIKSLINNISQVYSSKKDIQVVIETNNLHLDLDKAIPLGLILNELLTNSYKHAFVDKDSGFIKIVLEQSDNEMIFCYSDNGVGIQTNNLESFNTLGMRLVKRLSHQLNSEAVLKSQKGVEVSIRFSL